MACVSLGGEPVAAWDAVPLLVGPPMAPLSGGEVAEMGAEPRDELVDSTRPLREWSAAKSRTSSDCRLGPGPRHSSLTNYA